MKHKIFVGPHDSGKSRVANLIAETLPLNSVYIISGRRFISDHPFRFSEMHDECHMIIIEDVIFDDGFYSLLRMFQFNASLDNDHSFKIERHSKCKASKTISIKQLIIITNNIPESILSIPIIKMHFNIIQFPLDAEVSNTRSQYMNGNYIHQIIGMNAFYVVNDSFNVFLIRLKIEPNKYLISRWITPERQISCESIVIDEDHLFNNYILVNRFKDTIYYTEQLKSIGLTHNKMEVSFIHTQPK